MLTHGRGGSYDDVGFRMDGALWILNYILSVSDHVVEALTFSPGLDFIHVRKCQDSRSYFFEKITLSA